MKKEDERAMEDATFIPRESGGRPVRAPCPMRRSRFPVAGLPSGRLLLYKLFSILTKIVTGCSYTLWEVCTELTLIGSGVHRSKRWG